MTHPLTNALAMRTAAANLCDREHAGAYWGRAILALPLEADHAGLLAEAVKLPEVAALIAKSDRIANWTIGTMLADHPENREKYPLLSEAIIDLRTALSALETP